jgi:hypothetical protein
MADHQNDAPILLLQWLDTAEYKETHAAMKAFSHEVKIRHADVAGKAAAISAIEQWLEHNPNAQFLFIGTHGNDAGIGPAVGEGIDWAELWGVLRKAVRPVALWLGACHSACAAKAWSPVKGHSPVDYAVGFPKAITAGEIEKVLLQLLTMTRINPITFVDQEIPKLRKALPNSQVQMHYRALTKAGKVEYVNVDEFPQRVGMSLKEYLERG